MTKTELNELADLNGVDELARALDGWARAYRDHSEFRFPSDPYAEFFPVDLENAAKIVRRAASHEAGVRERTIEECIGVARSCSPMDWTPEGMRSHITNALAALAGQPKTE